MIRIRTNHKVFKDIEVIDEFGGKVQLRNIRPLVHTLTQPLARKINEVKEENENIYFKIHGLWVKAGDEVIPPPSPSISEKELKMFSTDRLQHTIEFSEFKKFAYILMKHYFNKMHPGLFVLYYQHSWSWYFSRCGVRIAKKFKDEVKFAPVIKILSQSPYKDEVLDGLQRQREEWEQFSIKLQQVEQNNGKDFCKGR